MYGYIRPDVPELRISEYTYYRGVYCGLCRRMGKCTGQCSRLSLTYDAAFLALLRLALTGGQDTALRFSKRHCAVHPFVRRPTLVPDSFTDTVLDYCAAASSLLLHGKLEDDKKDETGAKKRRASCAALLFSAAVRRAKSKYPGLDRAVADGMASFEEAEAACLTGTPSVDLPADAFGAVLATIASFGLAENEARVAAVCGRHLGRWLYLVDAADDYEADVRGRRFNPLYALYGTPVLEEETRRVLEGQLRSEVTEIVNALDLIAFSPLCGKELPPLLDNIIRVSLPKTAHAVLFPEEKHTPKGD